MATAGAAGGSPAEGRTDIAALSAAIVAIAVSMAVVPGPWEPVGATIAFTLILVVVGYVWGNSRTVSQSLAVAAVLGVIAIPIVGLGVEYYYAHDKNSFLLLGKPLNCLKCNVWQECDPRGSSVNNIWQIGTWVVVAGVAFVTDLRKQRKAQ